MYDRLSHQELVTLVDVMNLKLKPDELYFAHADFYPPGHTQFFIESNKKKGLVYSKSVEINSRTQVI